jgi:polyisoprenoid-binding protein YceI
MFAPARPLILAAAVLLAACTPAPDMTSEEAASAALAESGPVIPDPALANGARAGTYTLDKYHASLVFAADHLGFSNYVGQFTRFDATLHLDPDAPQDSRVTATIDPTSLIIPTPPEGFLEELLGPQWLNTETFPEMRYESTAVTLTSPKTAKVDGTLTFLGASHPVSLDVTFNGAYEGFPPYDPNARAGFHAEGSLSRSAFGMTYGLPPEGSTMGVGDEVKFWIDAEFTGPPVEDAEAEEDVTP